MYIVIHIYIYIYIYTYICVYKTYLYIYKYIYIYKFIFIYWHMYVYNIYIYIYLIIWYACEYMWILIFPLFSYHCRLEIAASSFFLPSRNPVFSWINWWSMSFEETQGCRRRQKKWAVANGRHFLPIIIQKLSAILFTWQSDYHLFLQVLKEVLPNGAGMSFP